MPAVSVIMPVFNTIEHIEFALDSLFVSTLEDFELICVDDGSEDGSKELLERAAGSDDRVHLIETPRPRSGPGLARNLGLRVAQGDFIAYLDSDDSLAPEMLKELLSAATSCGAEVAIGPIEKFIIEPGDLRNQDCGYRRILKHLDGQPFQVGELGKSVLDLRFAVWNKIYRRDFLLKHSILFPEGVFYEDLYFTYRCLFEAETLVYANSAPYFNRKERIGATTFGQSSRTFDIISQLNATEKYLANNWPESEVTNYFPVMKFRKLCSHFHKVSTAQVFEYFAALRESAAVVDMKKLTSELSDRNQVRMQHCLTMNWLEFATWSLWDSENRREIVSRRGANRQDEVRRLRSRLEKEVRAREFAEKQLTHCSERPWRFALRKSARTLKQRNAFARVLIGLGVTVTRIVRRVLQFRIVGIG